MKSRSNRLLMMSIGILSSFVYLLFSPSFSSSPLPYSFSFPLPSPSPFPFPSPILFPLPFPFFLSCLPFPFFLSRLPSFSLSRLPLLSLRSPFSPFPFFPLSSPFSHPFPFPFSHSFPSPFPPYRPPSLFLFFYYPSPPTDCLLPSTPILLVDPFSFLFPLLPALPTCFVPLFPSLLLIPSGTILFFRRTPFSPTFLHLAREQQQ